MKIFWQLLGQLWLFILLIGGVVGFVPSIIVAFRSGSWAIGLPFLMVVCATVGLAGVLTLDTRGGS